MASLKNESKVAGKSKWKIRFRDHDKQQQVIWLGDVPEHTALEFKSHLEHLLHVKKRSLSPEPATIDWLTRVSAEQRDKLARFDLVESTQKRESRQVTIDAWFVEYIAERADVADNTRKIYREVRQNLVDYFGTSRLLKDVAIADAKRFRVWLATQSNRRDKNRKCIADSTVRRRTGICKQFWSEALTRGLVDSNPFADLPSANKANPDRQFFVTHEMIAACLEQATNQDWRTIMALCRFGGLRCPSEVLGLKWTDIDLPGGKMLIDSDKTGLRLCPIFVELRPFLEQAWDAAPTGATHVITSYRSVEQNLRTQFERIIKQAGLVPWPRLFQNLRASRETELMGRYPAKDVASWIGNSVPVAMKHYAMATDEAFQSAAGLEGNGQGNKKGNILAYQEPLSSNHPEPQSGKNTVKTCVLMPTDEPRGALECAREESNLHGIISH